MSAIQQLLTHHIDIWTAADTAKAHFEPVSFGGDSLGGLSAE